jgi:hypothetical protein
MVLIEENPEKPKFPPRRPRVVRPPPMTVRPPIPENLATGQPSTSHRLISQYTPWIVVKLQGYLGYLLGNLSTKGAPLKRYQSMEIAKLGPLGQ